MPATAMTSCMAAPTATPFTAATATDILYGQDGNDYLNGGHGHEKKCMGGKGDDVYMIQFTR